MQQEIHINNLKAEEHYTIKTMKHYMFIHRLQIDGYFKIAIKVFDKTISETPLSVTILDEIPKGLKVGRYNLTN